MVRALHKRKRFLLSEHGKDPDIVGALGYLFVSDILSVIGPGFTQLIIRGVQQWCFCAGSIGVLYIDVRVSFSVGRKRDSRPRWPFPHGIEVIARVDSQSRGSTGILPIGDPNIGS